MNINAQNQNQNQNIPTPFAHQRKANSYYKALDSHVISMEARAHCQTLQDYSLDIFQHLNELEQCTQLQPQLLATQPEITLAMRPVLFDFLLDVHSRLQLSHTSFYLTISIIDRYCSLRVVRKDHFQLLGLASLWIASKFTDSKHRVPSLAFLRATCCDCYSQALFLEMECHILKSLDWEVDAPTHDSYIDLILLEKFQNNQLTADVSEKLKNMANYICQFLQFHVECTFTHTVSQIALASIIASTHALMLREERLSMCYGMYQGSNMEILVERILVIIKDATIPTSVKSKFHQSKSEFFPLMQALQQYSYESRRQFTNTPRAPHSYYLTPPVSRQTSQSDAESVFSSRGSMSTINTPSSSCTASPMELLRLGMKPQPPSQPLQQIQQKGPVQIQPLKEPQEFPLPSLRAKLERSLSRKRSRSFDQ